MESMSLLNMLAEVASEKLQTDPTVKMITKSEESKKNLDSQMSSDLEYHNLGKPMTLLQVSNISDNNILRLFTISQANEMKRKFYFTCRLIPQYCEETFQSFGSEEKARNLMKKHLKEHLYNLLNEFKDTESREKYILRTVNSSKTYGNGDFRVGSKRAKKSRGNTKIKMIVEKENTSKLLKKPIIQSYTEKGTSLVNPEEPNVDRQTEPLSCIADTPVSFSTQQNTAPIAMNSLTQYNSQISNIEVMPNINSINFDAINNSKCITSNNGIMENSIGANVSENNYQYATSVLQTPAYVLNLPNAYSNGLGVCSNQISITKGSNIIEFIPTTQYIYREGGSSDVYNIPNTSSNIVNENIDSQIQHVEGTKTQKNVDTEIIDIKIEEPVKLEVLSNSEEPVTEYLSTISHDHGYVGDENVQMGDAEQCKDEKVGEELMSLWDDITGGSGLIDFNSCSQSTITKDTDTKEELMQEDSDTNKVEFSQNLAEIKKKKVRLKGRGKFIGQNKNEKERALNFIEKIKSQPNLQLENLECSICNPPRVFTAAATLLSHYKSHAGIRPYVCVFCESVFTRQHSLNYHYLIHLNQTRFTCVDCGRKFRHPSHFKEHQRRHTGESPFECTDCFMRFKTRNTFKRHLRTRHGKKLTTQGSVHTINEDINSRSPKSFIDTNEEQTLHQNKDLDNQFDAHTSNTFSTFSIEKSLAESNQKVDSEESFDRLHEKEPIVESFDSTLDKNCLSYEHNKVKKMMNVSSSLVCSNQKFLQIKYSDAPKDSDTSVAQSSANIITDKVSVDLISSVMNEKSAQLSTIPEMPVVSAAVNQEKREFTYVLKKTDTSNLVDGDSKVNFSYVNNTTEIHSTNFLEIGETSKSMKMETDPVLKNHNSPYFVSRDNSNSVIVSQSQNYNNMKSVVSGSILGALLTSGTSGVHRGYSISTPLKNTSEVIVKEQKITCINESTKKTDKWDSLMREVVSLSTMVKEKTEPKIDYSSYTNHNTHNSSELSKEVSNNIINYDRPGSKDVLSEVYVLKYANGSSGTRIAKVFKANPSFSAKEMPERRKENANVVVETPILIRSSLGSWKERRD